MVDTAPETGTHAPATPYDWRFWGIIAALSVTSILSALDVSAISTAMPSMVEDLGSNNAYIWIANAYFLTMTAFQPLYGQTANIFGRRSLTLAAVFFFAAGSAISGPAQNLGMLIAGRAIQGIGGGGVNVMIDMIIGDLVPVRERPKYLGVVFMVYTVAVALGPVVGGLLAERVSWRWVFYINLPVSGAAFVMLLFVLRVQYKKDTAKNSLKRVDFLGNALLIASVVAVLIALTWGGDLCPWSSWRTLVPLILGIAGLIAFLALQTTTWVPEPTMPLRIFSNRTSLTGFGLTFLHSTMLYWSTYFLPLYFQAVLNASPITSGVDLLPTIIVAMPFAILAGQGVTKLGRYRPFHFIGYGLVAIGFGLYSRFDSSTSTAYWAGTQCITASGIGILTTTTLPAVQAPLAEEDQAVATATWAFVRSFGGVWGVAIPAAVFNTQVNRLVGRLDQESLRSQLSNGGAYGLASSNYLASLNLDSATDAEVKDIYVESLQLCWQVGIGFALLGFLISFCAKEITMRTDLETQFGMEVEKSEDDVAAVTSSSGSDPSGGQLAENTKDG
ncbi:putative multidrug resistance protein fnx1 [Xylariaceae sp. FL0662B]|nr:putative multidrug resistance protein fnx1 [Xylariaceae sp. FL0662B]